MYFQHPHNVLSVSQMCFQHLHLPVQANNSILVGKIEPKLELTQWNQKSTCATHVVADFMSNMGRIPLRQFRNLGAVIGTIITSASYISRESYFVHLVSESEMFLFDPYQKYIQSDNETILDQGPLLRPAWSLT